MLISFAIVVSPGWKNTQRTTREPSAPLAGFGCPLTPCAEHLLSERAVQAIAPGGIVPLVSHAHQLLARALRLQSVARPAARLAGPWHGA